MKEQSPDTLDHAGPNTDGAAAKRWSAILSLACLAVAVAIYLGMDTLTSGAWSEYLRLREAQSFKTSGPIRFEPSAPPPGAYPQPDAPGYGQTARPYGG